MTALELEKVGLLVDVQNIYYTCRQAYNGNFNYNQFWAQPTREREIICAYALRNRPGRRKTIAIPKHPARHWFHRKTQTHAKASRWHS